MNFDKKCHWCKQDFKPGETSLTVLTKSGTVRLHARPKHCYRAYLGSIYNNDPSKKPN